MESTVRELKEEIGRLKNKLADKKSHDPMTGLYAKDTFFRLVEERVKETGGKAFTMICVDTERFKLVNVLYGIERGDHFLRYIADRLAAQVCRDGEYLARMGGDVFLIYTERDEDGLESLVNEIRRAFHGYSPDIELVPAIGFYRCEEPEISPRLMCDRAILAASSVKGDYTKKYGVYRSDLMDDLIVIQEILNDTGNAFLHEDFKVYIQPQCNTKTGKIVGGEALVRWVHPDKGIILPDVFIPIFEKTGLIQKLDVYVWEEVARRIRAWIDKGSIPIPVSVNVSRIDILGMDVFGALEEIVARYRLDRRLLELEITESAYVSRQEEIVRVSDRLMRAGYTVLIDDFGSGYSSLSMLKDISAQVLKLDMRFLVNQTDKSKNIIESVLHMAKWQDLRIIAEGVETKEQVDFLWEIGCCYAQGFYYYKPLPLEEFEKVLSDPNRVDEHPGLVFEKNSREKLRFKDLFYENVISEELLNNLVGGVALFQYDGCHLEMLKCNEEYSRLVKRLKLELQKEQDLLQDLSPEAEEKVQDALLRAKTAGREKYINVQIHKKRRNQETAWVNVKLFYLRRMGNCHLYCGVFSEITEQMRHMQDLRLSEEMFRVAMDCSGDTLFELDIPTRTARYSRQSREKFGLEECVADAPEGFIRQNTVCPEYEEMFRDVFRAIYEGKDFSTGVIKSRMGDGSVVWNRIMLTALKDKEGRPVKAVGLVKNVTEEVSMGMKMSRARKEGDCRRS